jgi:hypothetical protein
MTSTEITTFKYWYVYTLYVDTQVHKKTKKMIVKNDHYKQFGGL